MRKIVFLVALMTVATQVFGQVEGSVATEKELVEDVVKKNFEISTAVYGLFLGFYTVAFELGLADGLFGVGPKVIFSHNPSWGANITAVEVFAVARLYPALYRRGFYVTVQTGYLALEYRGYSPARYFESIPFMTGLGFKWVINQFSFDLGGAFGRRFFIVAPPGELPRLNEGHANIAYDGYLLFGFRF